MTWKDGSHYKGDWKKGVPHGLGISSFILGTFKLNGEEPKTGLYEDNVLIKEIKQHEHYKSKKFSKKEPLILSVIP